MKKIVAALTCALLLGGTARAQEREIETGSRLRERQHITTGDPYDIREARLIAARMITCSVNVVTGRGRTLLMTEPNSSDEDRAARLLISSMGDCLTQPQQVRFPRDVLRGGVAEALLHNEFRHRPLPHPATPIPVREYRLRDDMNAQEQARIGRKWMAACTVLNDPAGTYALLRTEVATPPETQALRRLVPAISPCVPAGVTLALTPDALRSVLAEEAYRFAAVQRDGSASPWAGPVAQGTR